MMELFLKIKGYENYRVSNFGNVQSKWSGKWKMMRPVLNSKGYYQVVLYKNGKAKH